MFYRVDYTVGLILAGFITGLLFSQRTRNTASSRLAGAYYIAVALLLIVGFAANAFVLLIGPHKAWTLIGGITGSIGGFLFGGIFGLAARRQSPRDLLAHPSVLAAICMAAAFTFAFAGIGKAFSMPYMTEFFTQSGYPVTFLKFIIIAEVLGGVGLLVPWAFLASLIGLTIDMFGAVATHIHNGDPLNDSTGAINMLIRLAAIAVLWALQSRPDKQPRTTRNGLVVVAVAAIVCLLVAAGGSAAVRHLSPPDPAASPSVSK
jgi:MFS family permease